MLPHEIDSNDVKYAIDHKFEIVGWQPGVRDGQHIKPHVTRFLLRDGRVLDVNHIKPIYYETKNGTWRPMSEVCTYSGNKNILLKPEALQFMSPRFMNWLAVRQRILRAELLFDYGPMGAGIQPAHMMFATLTTVYPDPSPETTTVDGMIYRNGPCGTWASHRGATTATNALDNVATQWLYVLGNGGCGTNQWYYFYRSFFLFDTSGIPDTDAIDSAIFSVHCTSKQNSNGLSLGASLIKSNPASNTALVVGDFDGVTFERQATDVSYAGISTTGYTDWTLNATGEGNIDKTGVSKFAVVSDADMDNSEPTWASGVCGVDSVYYADQTGTSSDPKLAVTHSAGGGPAQNSNFLMFMK